MARLRTLLICLLMLALPVQGWAAAGMLYCGSQGTAGHGAAAHSHGPARDGGHPHEQASSAPSHDHAQAQHTHSHTHAHPSPAAAGEAGHAAHHPHAAHADDRHAAAGDALAMTGGPEGDTSTTVGCTVCAACCGATAVTSPALFPTVTTVSRTHVAGRLALHLDFLTDGPRRPPRS